MWMLLVLGAAVLRNLTSGLSGMIDYNLICGPGCGLPIGALDTVFQEETVINGRFNQISVHPICDLYHFV